MPSRTLLTAAGYGLVGAANVAQAVHLLPQLLPRLALGLRQFGQGIASDAG
jgi:hypothetical protein